MKTALSLIDLSTKKDKDKEHRTTALFLVDLSTKKDTDKEQTALFLVDLSHAVEVRDACQVSMERNRSYKFLGDCIDLLLKVSHRLKRIK